MKRVHRRRVLSAYAIGLLGVGGMMIFNAGSNVGAKLTIHWLAPRLEPATVVASPASATG